jgi:hypothetical protein
LVSENVETDEMLCPFVDMVEDVSDETDVAILFVSVVIESDVFSLVTLLADDPIEFCLLVFDDMERCESDKLD